jgi:hypothetical protein
LKIYMEIYGICLSLTLIIRFQGVPSNNSFNRRERELGFHRQLECYAQILPTVNSSVMLLQWRVS